MPHRLYDWLTRIKTVEREWAVSQIAINRLMIDVGVDPSLLDHPLRHRDVRTAAERIDGTYLVRIFAEFESGLRSFWKTLKSSRPRTEHLLDSIGRRQHIPDDTIAEAQNVREYRNHLVHESENRVESVAIPDARSRLCKYFSFLPPKW